MSRSRHAPSALFASEELRLELLKGIRIGQVAELLRLEDSFGQVQPSLRVNGRALPDGAEVQHTVLLAEFFSAHVGAEDSFFSSPRRYPQHELRFKFRLHACSFVLVPAPHADVDLPLLDWADVAKLERTTGGTSDRHLRQVQFRLGFLHWLDYPANEAVARLSPLSEFVT